MTNMGIWFLAYDLAIFCPIRVSETYSIYYYNIQIHLESATFLIKFLLFLDCPTFLGCPTYFWAVLLHSYFFPLFSKMCWIPCCYVVCKSTLNIQIAPFRWEHCFVCNTVIVLFIRMSSKKKEKRKRKYSSSSSGSDSSSTSNLPLYLLFSIINKI